MEGSEFDEIEFFSAIAHVRALLIGRRALIALGLPVMTADYDFWIALDDTALFNAAAEPFGLFPNRTIDEARQVGRYVLENDERVDVLVARSIATVDGAKLSFDDAWARRVTVDVGPSTAANIPCIDDLILTKRIALRPKDAEDVRWLETLRRGKP